MGTGLSFLYKSSLALAQGYQLQVPLPGVSGTVSGPGQYIQTIFKFGLSIVGITALLAIVIGGFMYLSSGGSETRKTSGKEWMWGAVIGLVLMLCSWLILNSINPKLTSLSEPGLMAITLQPHLGLGYDTVTGYTSMAQVNQMPIFSNATVSDALTGATSKYNVDKNLASFVLAIESGGNPNAVSPKGALGLGQLMPGTATEMGVTNPYDPQQNIYGSVGYMAKIRDVYLPQKGLEPTIGNVLASYNTGFDKVATAGGWQNITNSETTKYLQAAQAKGFDLNAKL